MKEITYYLLYRIFDTINELKCLEVVYTWRNQNFN
jgi:hypothetical protein